MAVIPKPDPDDPLKVRRTMAFVCIGFALMIFPVFIACMVTFFCLDKDIAKILIYFEGGLTAGPIGAYLYGAQRLQSKDNNAGE